MIFTGDYHTHTKFSDGSNTLTENAQGGLKNKTFLMAATDHGYGSLFFHMDDEKVRKQKEEAIQIRQSLGYEVVCGVEANILGDGTLDIPMEKIKQFELLNIGFHRFVNADCFKRDKNFYLINGWGSLKQREAQREKNTDIYLKVMENYPVDVLGHLNHRCLIDTEAIAQKAAEKGIYIELNEQYVYELEKDIDILINSNVEFIIGSDAHKSQNVGSFNKVMDFMIRHNVPIRRIVGVNHKRPILKPKN